MSISRLKTRGEVPPPVCFHSCIMDDRNVMFSIGGVQSSGDNVQDPYMIDMKTFTWSPMKYSDKFDFKKHSTVFYDKKFYSYADDGHVYKFSPGLGGVLDVEKIPMTDPKPIPRSEHSACVVIAEEEPWMLIFGGRSKRKNMVLPDLWGFNLNTETWKRIGSLKARYGHIAHLDVNTNKVVVFGGTDGKGVQCDTVFHIDCNNNYKRTIVKCSGKKPTPRSFMGSSIYDDRICVFGGLTAEGPKSDCYTLDLKTHKWSILSNKLGPFRLGHGCFCLGEFMYSFGGKSDPDKPRVSGDFLKIKIGMLVGKFAKRVEVRKEVQQPKQETTQPQQQQQKQQQQEEEEEEEQQQQQQQQQQPKQEIKEEHKQDIQVPSQQQQQQEEEKTAPQPVQQQVKKPVQQQVKKPIQKVEKVVEKSNDQEQKQEASENTSQPQKPQQNQQPPQQQQQPKKKMVGGVQMFPVAGRVAQAASRFNRMRGRARGVRRVRSRGGEVVRGKRGVRRVAVRRGSRGVRRVAIRGQRPARRPGSGSTTPRGTRGVRRVVRRVVRSRGVRRPVGGRGQRGRARGVRRVVRRSRGVRRVRRGRGMRRRIAPIPQSVDPARQKKIDEMKKKKEALMKQQAEKKNRIERMRKIAEEQSRLKKEKEEQAHQDEENRRERESERRRLAEIERKKQVAIERQKREEARREREEGIRRMEEQLTQSPSSLEAGGGVGNEHNNETGEEFVSAVPSHMMHIGGRERSKTKFKKLFAGVGIGVLPTTKKFVVEVDDIEKEVEMEMAQKKESKVEIVEEHKRYNKVQQNGFRRFVMGNSVLRTFVRKPKRSVSVPKAYLEYLKKEKQQQQHEEEWPLKEEYPYDLLTASSLMPTVKRRSKVIQNFKNEAKEYPKINRMLFLPYCEPFRKKKTTKRERPEWYLQYKLSIGQTVEKEENFEELFNYSVTHLKPIAVNVQKKEQKISRDINKKKNVEKKKIQERRKKRKKENTTAMTANFVAARLERAQAGERLTLAAKPKRKGKARRRRTKRAIDLQSLKTVI